jgi:hypothetical protein
MTDPLIFTAAQLAFLGLEHDPSAQNETTPYPYVFDRPNGVGLFFNPGGDLPSFRMLQRAMTAQGWLATIFTHTHRGGPPTFMVSFSMSNYGTNKGEAEDPDLITAYVRAVSALASP